MRVLVTGITGFAGCHLAEALLAGGNVTLSGSSRRAQWPPAWQYATWRATRQSSGYDIKTFEVRARPTEKVNGLRPGMSVLVDRS